MDQHCQRENVHATHINSSATYDSDSEIETCMVIVLSFLTLKHDRDQLASFLPLLFCSFLSSSFFLTMQSIKWEGKIIQGNVWELSLIEHNSSFLFLRDHWSQVGWLSFSQCKSVALRFFTHSVLLCHISKAYDLSVSQKEKVFD